MCERNFTKGQQKAFDLICQGHNIFIHGAGGVGKSYLIEKVVDTFPSETLVLATTGTAAMNISGQTLHSAMSLPIGHPTKQDLRRVNKKTQELFRTGAIKRIILDEASMITAGVFYSFYQRLLRFQKKTKNRPSREFQIILVGDMLQCPAINSTEEINLAMKDFGTDRFFNMKEFKDMDFKHIGLNEVVRQDDVDMKKQLQRIRWGVKVPEAIEWFNTNCCNTKLPENSVVITTTNKDVDRYNQQEFNKNTNPVLSYYANVDGEFKVNERPCQDILHLKKDTRVMLIKNDPDGRWINGSTGTTTLLCTDGVWVKLDHSGEECFITCDEWEKQEYYTEKNDYGEEELRKRTVATYTQLPLAICYSITGQKSQGKSLDNAIVDLSWGSHWATGLCYVMLSRIKSKEGLLLKRPIKERDVNVDKEAVNWLRSLKYE